MANTSAARHMARDIRWIPQLSTRTVQWAWYNGTSFKRPPLMSGLGGRLCEVVALIREDSLIAI